MPLNSKDVNFPRIVLEKLLRSAAKPAIDRRDAVPERALPFKGNPRAKSGKRNGTQQQASGCPKAARDENPAKILAKMKGLYEVHYCRKTEESGEQRGYWDRRAVEEIIISLRFDPTAQFRSIPKFRGNSVLCFPGLSWTFDIGTETSDTHLHTPTHVRAMDSNAPKPKATHGGKRAGSGRKKKLPTLGNPPENPNSRHRNTVPPSAPPSAYPGPSHVQPESVAPFFGPYNTHEGRPVVNQTATFASTGRPAFWSSVWHRQSGEASSTAQPESPQRGSVPTNVYQPHISPAEFEKLTEQLQFIDENDEYGDIASGDKVINDSLVDAILEASGTNPTAMETDSGTAEAENDSVLQKQFIDLKAKLTREITEYGSPLCYLRGDFYDRPPHPVFAIHRSTASNTGLDPAHLYARDVFIWIPSLLPGAPERFKCDCGKPLSRNGFNDNPIARRVRALPADFFLLTNRFVCNPRRSTNPGCGKSYQGSDPHIIAQLPSFVQPAFPAYISARGAVSKTIMRLMCNTFATRFGPSPFSEMVSEVQHRHHAEGELMYLAAVIFYGQRGCKQFSSFEDRQGYAGSPPSVGYVKGLFTDFVSAHRIYIERDISSLPLTIAKADHTFHYLKYIGRLKGEPIFSAAYNILNEHEELRGHSMTQSKSLSFVQDLWDRIQGGLKNSNHPPTQVLYTDSPQTERSFHESINISLTKNVVPVTQYTDLPPLTRNPDTPTTLVSNSMDIEDTANSLLEELGHIPSSSSQLHVVALSIKTEQRPGESLRLDMIQLRTANRICVFKVTDLTTRSDVLPSLRAILTNPAIIKIGHSICRTLEVISEALSLPEIDIVLKTRNPPILDLGKYAKLKGVFEDPSISLVALAGAVLKMSFIAPQFQPYPWLSRMASELHWSRLANRLPRA
ncbi:hypothetical protein B0H16DRAFT_1824162 [Mycena metata]|uniref:3'-5' exonuclease domain-containing protein n=1 Tax=Mycena metata TaxID=1033252 RepID=A0AAD7GYF9_9AGAR|nr:hypothetical protein B0H16DRAFT_1824162 [Mycena metata]